MATQFNDTSSDKNGLIQICERKVYGADFGAISDNTKRMALFTVLMNSGLNRFTALALQYETRWQFHDANYTTHPEAYTDLSAGQSDYALSDLHLQLRAVYVKNSDGTKVPLRPVDEFDFTTHGQSIDDFFDGDGMPQYYDKKGRSIKLFPAPSATDTTLSGGLFVTYTSAPSYFADDDTTKEAGIPLIFQDYPAIHACRQYAIDNQMRKKAQDFTTELREMEENIMQFYSKRDRDDRPKLSVRKKSYV